MKWSMVPAIITPDGATVLLCGVVKSCEYYLGWQNEIQLIYDIPIL